MQPPRPARRLTDGELAAFVTGHLRIRDRTLAGGPLGSYRCSGCNETSNDPSWRCVTRAMADELTERRAGEQAAI